MKYTVLGKKKVDGERLSILHAFFTLIAAEFLSADEKWAWLVNCNDIIHFFHELKFDNYLPFQIRMRICLITNSGSQTDFEKKTNSEGQTYFL